MTSMHEFVRNISIAFHTSDVFSKYSIHLIIPDSSLYSMFIVIVGGDQTRMNNYVAKGRKVDSPCLKSQKYSLEIYRKLNWKFYEIKDIFFNINFTSSSLHPLTNQKNYNFLILKFLKQWRRISTLYIRQDFTKNHFIIKLNAPHNNHFLRLGH